MTDDFEKVLEAAIISLKKAISGYNNLLNDERIEDFIINFHMSLNRLMIAYCIKNNISYKKNKTKIITFYGLIQVMVSKNFFQEGEQKFFDELNWLRNSLAHFFLEKADANSEKNYVFLNVLIRLWQKLKIKVDGSILTDYNLFLVPPKIETLERDTYKSVYIDRIEILMNNSLSKKISKELNILILRSQDWMKDNYDKEVALSQINQDTFLPKKFANKMKNRIPDFSPSIFSRITHVFSIKTDCWTYTNWDINENKHNTKYTIKNELTNQLLYTNDYFNRILNICTSYDSYQKFFNGAYREKVHFDIDKFEWENADVKNFINGKLSK